MTLDLGQCGGTLAMCSPTGKGRMSLMESKHILSGTQAVATALSSSRTRRFSPVKKNFIDEMPRFMLNGCLTSLSICGSQEEVITMDL